MRSAMRSTRLSLRPHFEIHTSNFELTSNFTLRTSNLTYVSRIGRADDREDRKGVNARVVDPDSPVEMRARDASGCTDRADRVATVHGIALMHIDHRQVGEQRKDAKPMIDDDGVAREVEIAGEHDAPAVRCTDWRP